MRDKKKLTTWNFQLRSVSNLLGYLDDVLDIHVVFETLQMQNQNLREDVEKVLL